MRPTSWRHEAYAHHIPITEYVKPIEGSERTEAGGVNGSHGGSEKRSGDPLPPSPPLKGYTDAPRRLSEASANRGWGVRVGRRGVACASGAVRSEERRVGTEW